MVSNCAGTETSQCTNLVVSKHNINCEHNFYQSNKLMTTFLVPVGAELHDLVNEVNDWIPFGLYFGVEISILEAIEKECTVE